MKMLIDAFGKRIFGVRYERLIRSVIICAVLYFGLRSAEFHIAIAPFVFWIISFSVTAGVMWNSLNSNDVAVYMMNILMMPFESGKLIAAYISTLGIHAFFMNTSLVWGIILAVTSFTPGVIAIGFLSAVLSVMVCTIIYIGGRKLSGYLFYDKAVEHEGAGNKVKSHKHNLVWTYLIRYIVSHKNYISNTIVIWIVAAVYPFFMTMLNDNKEFYSIVMYIGFGVVAINTPLSVLVSCDPEMERGIKCLPGAIKAFFVPYGVFIFLNICVSYTIYLISWFIKGSFVTGKDMICAFIFAGGGAVFSIVLEYFLPVKNWKVESDLLHHPRKYVVPAAIILLASLVQSLC